MIGRLSRLFGARPRLATRIALTIIAPLIAIQLINFGLFLLLPRPVLHLYRSDWLAETSVRLARMVFALPKDQREAALAAAPEAEWLDLAWNRPVHGPAPRREPQEFVELEQTIRTQLIASVTAVNVRAFGPAEFRPLRATLQIVPPGLGEPPPPQEHRFGLPDGFDIAITGGDGTVLMIASRQSADRWLRTLPLISGLLVSLVLIGILSTVAARSIIRRLEQMAAATERLGLERKPTPISEQGLGEFAIVARSLNEMQARIQRFVDERTRMVAAISHDLRTPLTRMKLTAEYVADEALKAELVESIDRMRHMIEATLAFASHDARGEAHVRTDVAAMLISLVDELSDMGHAIRYEGPDHCERSCQPEMMRRALANLLDNAVKFGTTVLARLLSGANSITILIEDDGPGIPAQQLGAVVEPFYRVEGSRNEETGGFGLGLSIANDIVLAHGGSMTLRNLVPAGLSVEIVLPGTLADQA